MQTGNLSIPLSAHKTKPGAHVKHVKHTHIQTETHDLHEHVHVHRHLNLLLEAQTDPGHAQTGTQTVHDAQGKHR